VNCPLRSGKTDGEMRALYRSVLVPVIQAFRPGLILVSAGFDAHAMDPIGGMQLTSAGFAALAALIRDEANDVQSPVVYALEGGYNLDALRDSVRAVTDVLKGGPAPGIQEKPFAELDEIRAAHARFWTL
jgi:acetoin utilization deacetylase AcuC-like enzyme